MVSKYCVAFVSCPSVLKLDKYFLKGYLENRDVLKTWYFVIGLNIVSGCFL